MRRTHSFLAGLCGSLLLAVPAFAQSNSGNSGSNDNPSGAPSNSRMRDQPGGMNQGNPGDTANMNRGASGRPGMAAESLPSADRRFFEHAATGGMYEIKMGQLAMERGDSQMVKDLGNRLATDHSHANQQLTSIAQRKGLTMPTDLDAAQQAKLDKMSKLHGHEFDRAFLKETKSDHDTDLTMFKKEAQQGQDQDLKTFAQETLPTLRTHDDMARRDLQEM